MLRKLLPAFLFALLLPGAATAQNVQSGVYLEMRAGASILPDVDADDDPIVNEIGTKTGWLIDGAVGYADLSGLRGEIALGFRRHEIDEIESGSITVDAEGDVSTFTAMLNGYYDFYLHKYGAQGAAANLTPFVGVGAGFAVISIEFDELNGVSIADDRDSDTVFAYQGIAGLSYAFTPNIAASLSYAYLATTEGNFNGTKADYETHNMMAGFRFTF